MPHRITDKCVKVGECKKVCPVDAVIEGDPIYKIDPDKCIDCGACAAACPTDGAIVAE